MVINKKIFKIIGIAIALVSLIFTLGNFDLFFIFPLLQKYSINNSNFISFNKNNEKIIDNKSGLELIKLNKNNEIDFFKKAGVSIIEDFENAYGNCVDNKGNIYTYDLKLGSDHKVKEEYVLKFNKNGKLIKTIFKDEFGAESNKGIAKILIFEDEFYYIYNDDDKFYLKNSYNEVVKKYRFDTNLALSYEVFSLDKIIVLTRDGRFLSLNEDGSCELVYDSNQHEGSIPINFSILDDKSIIYSDIGTRQFAIIKNNSNKREIIEIDQSDDFLKRSTYTYTEAEGDANNFKIMATDGNSILNYSSKDNKTEILNDFNFSLKFLISYFIFVINVIISSILVLYILFLIFKKIIKSKSFVVKISALIMLGTVLITGIFCLISFGSFDDRLISEIKKRSEVVSLFIRKELPCEKIEKIKNNSQYMDPDYLEIKNNVKDIFEKYKEMTSNFYCVLYKVTHNGKVVSVLYDLNATYPTLTPVYNYDIDSIEYEVFTNKKSFTSDPEYWPTGYFIYSYDPILNKNGESVGIIEIGSNLNALRKENNELILSLFLNIVLMVVFIILFVLELLIFAKERNKAITDGVSKKITNISMTAGMSRLFVFLIYFSTNIISGFLTIYLFSIAPETNISKEFLISIPISIEILTSLFALPLTAPFIKLIRMRKTAFLFGLIFVVGMFLKTIPNIWIFTLSNALCGIGWGVLIRIVSAILSKANKLEYFNGYDASLISGVTCALIFGSFLINFLDYFLIFLISALLSIFVIYFIILYVKNQDEEIFIKNNTTIKSINVFNFLFSKKIFIFLFLILVPMTICDYYSSYFFPVMSDMMGLNETNIGYVCTLNRLCSILFSSTITNFLSKYVKRYLVIFIYISLFAISMIMFSKFMTLPILIISVIIFGFANSFGYSFFSDYFVNISIVKDFGYDKAISLNTLIANIACMVAPFVFGLVITNSIPLFYLSYSIIIFGIVFLVFNSKSLKLIR